MKQFHGSYAVNVSRFTPEGSDIDPVGNRRFIDWQVSQGVPGMIILGPSGAFLTVTDADRRGYVEHTIARVKGRIDILAGAVNAHCPTATHYAREAQDAGAQGVMIIPPLLSPPPKLRMWAIAI